MPGDRGGRSGRGRGGGKRGGGRDGGRIQPKQDADVLSGPGVMITCVKNKERSAIVEAEKHFAEIAHELYPELDIITSEEPAEPAEDAEMDIEKELAADLEKERNFKKETPKHFMSCQTDAMCIIYVNFRPPIDPVKVVEHIFNKVESTGVMNWNYCLRLTPISATCSSNMESLVRLAKRLLPPHFDDEEHQDPKTFRIETKGRYNDESLSRNNVVEHIPKLVAPNRGHKVKFDQSDKVIIIESYKNATGMSIVENFDRYKKFNLRETQTKFHKAANAPSEPTARVNTPRVPVTDPRSKHFGEHYKESEVVKAGAEALLTDILKGKAERDFEAASAAAAVEDKDEDEQSKRPLEDVDDDHASKKLRLI